MLSSWWNLIVIDNSLISKVYCRYLQIFSLIFVDIYTASKVKTFPCLECCQVDWAVLSIDNSLIRKLLNRKFVHNGDNNKRCLYSKTSQECKKTLKLTSLLQNQFPKFIHFGKSWRSLGRQVTTSKTKSSVYF